MKTIAIIDDDIHIGDVLEEVFRWGSFCDNGARWEDRFYKHRK